MIDFCAVSCKRDYLTGIILSPLSKVSLHRNPMNNIIINEDLFLVRQQIMWIIRHTCWKD